MITLNQVTIVSVAAVMSGIAAIYNYAGDAVDAAPWVAKDDFEIVAGDVKELKRAELRRAIALNQQLRYDNLQRQDQYKKAGQPVPLDLVSDLEDLEAERTRLRRELDQ